MTVYDSTNIFARILRSEIPCTSVYTDEYALAFADIFPKCPIHILIIPRGDYTDVADFSARGTMEEITGFWRAVGKVAAQEGLIDKGFRVVANTGHDGHQEIPHFHVHLLGGIPLGPMVRGD